VLEEKKKSGETRRRRLHKNTGSTNVEVKVLPAAEERLIKLSVNGQTHKLNVEPQWTLAEVLREKLTLTGTKVACNEGTCGACTALMDGMPILSCMTLAIECDGKRVETIEGLAENKRSHPIIEAFIEHHGIQCGFCSPGQIMSAKALLERNPSPTEDDVKEALSGNLCICGCQPKIIKSVLAAAKRIRDV